ncbi:1854_t:CDS:2 [Diversispora eburnea]|uniref:1854_t:CDS:1 n=1 Tax=Diversispora eburnea TaxID=1213867 RepID=A0A9N8ZHR8_9GLOM|nr:1854_t:CDS:2 [Diversispora eburnea]
MEKMEESNNIKTFSKQNYIPRQPIPTLHETLDRYKKTLIPLLSTEEYNNAIIAVDEFMKNGIGEILQGPLCMNQYKRQFGVSRIPDFPVDRIITTWPSIAKHIIVIYKDQIFKVQVLGERGERVSIDSIKRQLHLLIERVNNYNNNSELQPPIGLLTGEHLNLETIDNALFVVALDDYSVDKDISHHNSFHAFNGRNRWFDKSIQIILQNNGQAGVNCEHTPSDAVASGLIFNDIVSKCDPPNSTSTSLPTPQHLNWVIDNTINDIIHSAQINIQNAIDNVDIVLLYYHEYGSNWLKSVKYSPDAFVQMAIQLAYYRQYGEPCATYESASTRGFLHGRTETVRSCSIDSLAFTKDFDDKDIKKEKKIELFTTAIKSHIEYMIAAVNGVDRHLLGLRTQLQSDKEKENASLFNDLSYQKSSYYKLSTSNMSLGVKFICGFGAVVPDGYGVCYMINSDKLRFSISSYKKCKETDSVIFRKTLIKTLDDLREILS